jgi:uncharacterized membrane protein YgaE (UPF0421/DUF939 family)
VGSVVEFRRPTRASVEFAVKAGVSAALAIWVGERIGLQDSYWAGISAVVATAGTLGASLRTAISRISATVVGLLIGLASLALPVSGTVVQGLTVFVALVVLSALSLDAGARLGAATTLIVTAIPGNHAVSDALARGANVPLGCAIAVAVGMVLLPRRAVDRLRADLQADAVAAGELARSAVIAYADGKSAPDLSERVNALSRANAGHVTALRDAAREPGGRGGRLLVLEQRVTAVESFIGHVGSLVEAVGEADDDPAPALVREELRAVASELAEAVGALVSDPDRSDPRGLRRTLSELDAAFAGARARRATATYPTEELMRLLSVMRLLHAAASSLTRLEPAGRATRARA